MSLRRVLLSVTLSLFATTVWLTACRHSVDAPADVIAVQKQLPETIEYNLHVKPILSDRCFACHGPDQAKQQAGLRLDTPEGAYEALAKSGHTAIVPGNPNGSELIKRILSTDPDEVMPTPNSNLTLSPEEKAILLKWVEQGAAYKEHWSLITPTMPELPTVRETRWVKNDIDRFVLARLEKQGLRHAPEADKLTLLRRVSLDLTGLPPTPAEITAFVNDHSPNAYEKVVNRLLDSPHYGERQAVDWLDLARYADTHGYQDDGLRTAWPYRDWVIRAFNQNLPFDRFITWQLAGDLLPKPTQDMLIATAFNRNHQQSQEGGIVDEEYRIEYVADRTNTFGKTMLGLTVECARCHDHKYDPISQNDYYSLFAFFNSNNDRGKVPYNGEAAPTLTLTKPETDARLRFIREKLTPIEQQLNPNRPEYQQRYSRWIAQQEQQARIVSDLGLIGHYSFDEPNRTDIGAFVKAKKEADKREQAQKKAAEAKQGKTAKKPTKKQPAKRQTKAELWKDPRNAFANAVNDTLPARLGGDPDKVPYAVPGRFGMARFLPGDSQIELPWNFAAFEQNQPFTISAWFKLAKPGIAATLMGRTAGPMDGQRGYQLDLLKDGRLKLTFSHVWPDNAIDLETVSKVPVNRWFQVAFTYDGMGRAQGLTLYLDGQSVPTRTLADHLIHSMVWGKGKTHWAQYPFMIARMHDDYFKDFAVDELRIYNRVLTPLELPRLAGRPDALTAALRTPTTQRTPVQRTGLYAYYVATQDSIYQQARTTALKLRGDQLMLYNESDQVMIMHERQTPRPTYVLNRGAYDAPGARVESITPAKLTSFPDDLPRNRLGLARWLLLADNPLFSRVAVNRVWQQYFGQGLVKSSDDFGNQGNLPSHPDLLDYLAVRFRAGGDDLRSWNVKALHKLIVMSATYRQSSTVVDKARDADPDNSLLSRGASHRLSAEQVRDNALAASGLLTQRIGGPSVHPYQPSGIWEALATRNAVKYVQNHGDSLYRRSMYTVWKRSSPAPMMLNFDAAERHTCIVKRQKTSTPLQALITLNDPQFIEAARVLAQRTTAPTPDQRIDAFFRAVISRPARPDEIQLMAGLFREELTDFRQHPKRAADLLAVGEYPIDKVYNPAELAAWTVVASTILNFDEAIIKR